MHGLIHDGRLRTCQSCLLGLMYALKVNVRSQVTIRYQVFQGYGLFRVSACWQLYKRSSSSLLLLVFLKFLCQREFPPQSDWISKCSRQLLHDHHFHTIRFLSFFAIQFQKNYSLLLNVESDKFFLALSSWVSFVVADVVVGVIIVGVVVVAIAIVGKNLCYYTSTNIQSQDQNNWEE